MSQKLNILMSHINGFHNATINEFLMFQKQAATLEFSTLGASYRSTRLSCKSSKKLLWRLIFANKPTYSYPLIACESSTRVITEVWKQWILIVDKEEHLMVVVLAYQLEDKAVHIFTKISIFDVWLSPEHASVLML